MNRISPDWVGLASYHATPYPCALSDVIRSACPSRLMSLTRIWAPPPPYRSSAHRLIGHVHAEETELSPGGEAHLKRFGPGSDDDQFESYLFMRKNPKGLHYERWFHAHGCRQWFHAARSTVTHEIFAIYGIDEPPPAIDANKAGSR